MEKQEWVETNNRFVAFFDIMGFKEMVARNSHEKIVEKLNTFKAALKALEKANRNEDFQKILSAVETKSITFSDSIIIFSKGDSESDANKILFDSYYIQQKAYEIGIPLKGAISFGKITVDFKGSLFFGQAIIDAHLLHEQLQMYSVILDHSFENKWNSMIQNESLQRVICKYRANFKTGRIYHSLVTPLKSRIDQSIKEVSNLYSTVSGHPRIYVDNTLDFLNFLKKQNMHTAKKK